MQFIVVSMICFAVIQSAPALHRDLEPPKSHETNVITEILSNYLERYFGQRQAFISFALSSVKIERKFVQENLVSELVTNPKLANFSYNILNKVDQSQGENKRVFNLIFVDGSDSLV